MERGYEPKNVGGLYKGKSKETDSLQGFPKKKKKLKLCWLLDLSPVRSIFHIYTPELQGTKSVFF